MEPSDLPSTTQSQRVLAAIVITDAVGFSARMSIDEETTLRLIQRDLRLMGDLCARYHGQLLKSTGDGLLMSFSSAVNAVSCSQEIQAQLWELAKDSPPGEALQHRIGVHLGDVLFSHSDILGNGVNIAARLQTQSVPGGICISQTIYDVIKARLDLNAIFLGPLRLKNIHEPVPAYQIPPLGEPTQPQGINEILTQWGTTDPLGEAVAQLQKDPNHWRIKKLLFGACYQRWENDPAALESFLVEEMVRRLIHRHPTLEDLEATLKAVVSRLNRQGEYLALSSRILAICQPIYAQKLQENAATALAPAGPDYAKVAVRLETATQAVRIKKLLYAVTTDTWENNILVLDRHRMDLLVATIHRMAPTADELHDHLQRIIQRLNRQEQYWPIADAILAAFQQLYGLQGMADSGTLLTPIALSNGVDSVPSAATRLEAATPEDGEEDEVDHPRDGMTVYEIYNEAPVVPLVDPSTSELSLGDRRSLFRLRQEIMRYTSPLRAKILLFSTLRSPFTFSHQDWLSLKEKTLDELIQEIFKYCPSFSDLESKLVIISHCLENPQENTQAAGAILQAMKPYYPA